MRSPRKVSGMQGDARKCNEMQADARGCVVFTGALDWCDSMPVLLGAFEWLTVSKWMLFGRLTDVTGSTLQ